MFLGRVTEEVLSSFLLMKERTLETNLMDMGIVKKHSHVSAAFIGLIQERPLDISNVGKIFYFQ
jgi:hypothetical protein